VYTGFLTQFADKLRIGPMTAGETLTRLGVSVDATDAAAAPAGNAGHTGGKGMRM